MLGSKGILTPLIPNCYVLCTPASKLASDFRPFDPGIIITQTCAISKSFCIQTVHFVYNIVTVHGRHFWNRKCRTIT